MTAVPKTPKTKKITMAVGDGPEIELNKVEQIAKEAKALPPVGLVLTKITVARMNGDDAALEAAFAEGKQLLEAEGLMPTEDEQGVDTIREYAADLDELKGKRKAAEALLEDIEKDWDERKKVDELELELEKAREQLKSRRHGNTQYLAQTEKVAKIKRDEAEAKEIISTYLVWHYRKTGEQQILMDEDNGDARQVVVSARLGGKMKYQTSLDLAPAEEPAA